MGQVTDITHAVSVCIRLVGVGRVRAVVIGVDDTITIVVWRRWWKRHATGLVHHHSCRGTGAGVVVIGNTVIIAVRNHQWAADAVGSIGHTRLIRALIPLEARGVVTESVAVGIEPLSLLVEESVTLVRPAIPVDVLASDQILRRVPVTGGAVVIFVQYSVMVVITLPGVNIGVEDDIEICSVDNIVRLIHLGDHTCRIDGELAVVDPQGDIIGECE